MPRLDPMSEGMAWASRITGVALGFALPILLGALIDNWLHSGPVGVLLGLVLGFTAGMAQLLRIAKDGKSGPGRPD